MTSLIELAQTDRVEHIFGKSSGIDESYPVGIPRAGRQPGEIISPTEFIVVPTFHGIDTLETPSACRRGDKIEFRKPFDLFADGRRKEILEILPPSRVGHIEDVCSEIIQSVNDDRTICRNLEFCCTILLFVPVPGNPVVPLQPCAHRTFIPAGFCYHVDCPGLCIPIFGIQTAGENRYIAD